MPGMQCRLIGANDDSKGDQEKKQFRILRSPKMHSEHPGDSRPAETFSVPRYVSQRVPADPSRPRFDSGIDPLALRGKIFGSRADRQMNIPAAL